MTNPKPNKCWFQKRGLGGGMIDWYPLNRQRVETSQHPVKVRRSNYRYINDNQGDY